MTNLAEATQAVRDEILAGSNAAEAIEWAAGEYAVSEAAIRARFAAAFHQSPEELAGVKIVARDFTAEARALAAEYASHYTLPEWQERALGREFWFQNERHVFAGYAGGKWPLRAINVTTGHVRQLRGPSVDRVLAELAA